jgi:hypothetical protein
MFRSRRHALLTAAAVFAAMPALRAETSGGAAPAPVAPASQAHVVCAGLPGIPMTSDAEQVLPLRLIRTLACGEHVMLLSGDESYTVHVRTGDGTDGYVAHTYLSTARPVDSPAPDAHVQMPSATPVNGIVRWEAGAPGCDRFLSQGRMIESVTADGVTVQVSVEDTGWKFRANLAVKNDGDSSAAVSPAHVSLDELQSGLKSLRPEDPRKLSHAKNHQMLWTEAHAQPSPSAVSSSVNGTHLETAAYRTQDYSAAEATSGSLPSVAFPSANLQPGQKASGALWFERDASAHELSLRVMVGDVIYDFPFSFEQKK